ncbi:Spermine synthase [Desulfarculus baarsii DSM 2075]|uniref:Polyamine aminopropyltransferase n=1 Tax=Desulfarculus baarsii (strain ATCC 33931 / DSM 2075 / LMG 7858 / VKM B-1802 / 2st14) TaxID=644282 RepID=E1QEH0_DESB2|nr:spermidine synthase [Desulfarculus baarsii]ADK83956.1 Spermine synthase [Desulfarculus baarsii DSM 2075]
MSGAETSIWVTEVITDWDVYHHGVSEVIAHEKTKYQEMYVVHSPSFGRALVLDGKWQSSQADEFLYHEPLVQPAMIAHGAPKKVLILGGGEGATIRETLRWKSVERVVMVDIDQPVVEACREHMEVMHQGAWDDPRLELVFDDAWKYLEDTREAWDVIISDLTDPLEEGPSFKLFTREFYEMARQTLAPGGKMVIQAGPVSPVELAPHARMVKTLAAVFTHTRSYCSHTPSYGRPWGFVLCSQEPLDTRPEPQAVDELLGRMLQSELKLIDGQTLLGMLQTPKHIRQAVERTDVIYTLAAPPRFGQEGR